MQCFRTTYKYIACQTKEQSNFLSKLVWNINHSRLLNDYLKQSKSELNYIESKRASDKLKELQDHEYERTIARINLRQREEMIHLERI